MGSGHFLSTMLLLPHPYPCLRTVTSECFLPRTYRSCRGRACPASGPACHSAALLPDSYSATPVIKRCGVLGMEGGVMGNWTRKGRETSQEEREVVLRMERDLGCLKLGCSDQTGMLITGISIQSGASSSAEPRSGSSKYLLRPEPSQ